MRHADRQAQGRGEGDMIVLPRRFVLGKIRSMTAELNEWRGLVGLAPVVSDRGSAPPPPPEGGTKEQGR